MIEYNISQERVIEIQTLNAKLVAIKNLYKEAILEGNSDLSNKLSNELAKTQIAYDKWFDVMTVELGAHPSPTQSWQVDFTEKKMYLIG